MTYPPPPGWHDPAGSGQQPSQPADPTLPMSGPPVPTQPGPVDPYAPANPYGGQQPPAVSPYAPADPYAAQQPPAVAPYAQPGQAPAYPGYGYPPAPPTNGMAVAAMVIGITGIMGLCGYGIGGIIGVVGAILGHIAKRQIRERGGSGEGMATAGIIMGWISTAIAVLATIGIIIAIVVAANQNS
ncbi:DUF4190 domain-containing protein [Micromonospora avicenniae]|uniref:DUF4190 domain-containing protein n=1 Tax=Micromonospora avicenniae TaxID=1198245 RepID=UPI00331BEB78